MKKLVSVLIGAAALAAIAPVLALALLHAVGGTAQADAPPATFWKVSMPDLGQHSNTWCWAGAAADSFWWFADNGYSGLMGGGGDPWGNNIEAASTNPLSACWYDARDAVDGLPAPVKGYPMVLRKIAEKTFTDTNQNGAQDPGEANYCYSQGVEKWDYLVGLENYVNSYAAGSFVVHDIIDPARCGVNTGLVVSAGTNAKNTRDPCSNGAGVPGVPGVDQVVRTPTFLDYQTELSNGQDVLLWMEPAPGYYFAETAHVVAGVAYNSAGGAFAHGTITVSDPWTHTTNASAPPPNPAPSGLHSDLALPPFWQSKPDHNNSAANNGTDPYNLCDVKSTNPLQIQCYDEDNGGVRPWQVYDMIFVSPIPSTDTPTPTSTPTNTPTSTPTRTPTPTNTTGPSPTPHPVGGVAEAPDVSSGASGGSSAPYAVIGGTIAGVLLLGAAGWYARRRWLT